MTQASDAIKSYRGQRGGFATHAKKLGADVEPRDPFEIGGATQYHFADGSTALTKGVGRNFQLWESGIAR